MSPIKKHWVSIALAIILIGSFFLMIFSTQQDSLIIDEKVHIPAGYLHVWEGDYRFNTEHPPLLNDFAGLAAKIAQPNLPVRPLSTFKSGGDQWEYGDLFFYESQNNVEKIIFWARLPFILLTLALIYLVFLWARTLFGPKAGLMAAALVGFSPNILAHGRLATTDLGLVFFFVLACWLLRKYYIKPTWANAALLGMGLGLAMVAKFSALILLPIILLGLIFLWFSKIDNSSEPLALRWHGQAFLKYFGQLFIILIVPIIIIWITYAFSMRSNLGNLPPVYISSETLGYSKIHGAFSQWLIVPVDKFIQGVEILSDHNTGGHWTYLNGQVDYRGWWYYFPYVLIYKLPLTALILVALAMVLFCYYRKGKVFGGPPSPIGGFEEFFIIFPPLLFLGASILSSIDLGIRHILPILPFLYIFVSRLVLMKDLLLKRVVIAVVIAHILIGIFAFPNYIAYFNQLAGGAKGGINHLVDSNLDWNQNIIRFGKYAQENNIKQVYGLCWDAYAFSYYGVESELLPNTPPPVGEQRAVVICAQQLLVTPEGFDISWVTDPPTGGPPDDIVANGVYIWRFDKKND